MGVIAAILLFGAAVVRSALWGLLSALASVVAVFLFLVFFNDYWPLALGIVAVAFAVFFAVASFTEARAKQAAPVRAHIVELSDRKMALYNPGVAHDDPRVLAINQELKDLGWE